MIVFTNHLSSVNPVEHSTFERNTTRGQGVSVKTIVLVPFVPCDLGYEKQQQCYLVQIISLLRSACTFVTEENIFCYVRAFIFWTGA